MARDIEYNREVERQIFSSPQALAAMKAIAKQVEPHVERFTPLNLSVTRGRISSGAVISGGVAVGYVATDSSFWHWFEYGSVHFSPSRPFAKGFEAAGLALESS